MRSTLITTMTFIMTFLFSSACYGHRHLAWTYESSVLPKGVFELEPWFTFSGGRNEYYSSFASRLEFEFGVTDRLLTAFYLNSMYTTSAETDSTENITGLKKSSSFSFSNEWKFNLLNSSVKPIGLALYFEYGISPDEIELEYKLILDKKTPKDIYALNIVAEQEFEFEFEKEANGEGEIEREKEIVLENDLAYMRLIRSNIGFGVELRNHNEIVEGEWEHSVLFGGPSFYYNKQNENGTDFYIILNVMPQITNLGGEAPAGELNLDEHERMTARVMLGFGF